MIRPNVVREEWKNTSRNPDPQYMATAAYMLRAAGYYVVSVADLEPGEERLDAPEPASDESYHRGEYGIEQLFELMEHAAVVVGGVGFILPVAIAYGTPLIIIGGGNGGHNAPERLVGHGMDGSKARFIMPDDYCRCLSYDHDCPKHISAFEAKFAVALDEVTGGVTA